MRYRSLIRYMLIAALWLAVSSGSAFSRPERKYHVLVLNSLQQGVPWTFEAMLGFQRTLALDEREIGLHIDYLHTKRLVMDRKYLDLKSRMLREEFRKLRFDLIVCIGSDALRFLLDRRDRLFPKTPVLFAGVGMAEAARARRQPLYEGLTADWNLKPNIELAMGLFPNTREVVFVHDNTTVGKALADDARALAPEFPEIKFKFIGDAAMSDVLDQVRDLREGSVLFTLPYSMDKAGAFFISDTGMREIVSASSVPSFGLWEFQSDEGIAGGLLIDGDKYGKLLAESAIHILRAGGFRGVSIPETTPAQYVFDWEQLQRFEPVTEAMPTGYVMVNTPTGLYETYGSAILGGLALLLLLIGIVAMLSLNTIRRKRAEEALRVSEERLKLALDASSDGIWDWDIQSGRMYCSPRCYTMLGYEPDEIPSDPDSWNALIDPEDAKWASKAMHAHLEGETSAYEVEHRMKAKDGSRRWVLSIGMVVKRDHSGRPLRMVGTRTDITDRKEAERERLEFERKVNEQKRQFYRETILSVTGGKLEICDHTEMAEYIRRAEMKTSVTSVEETTGARIEVEEYLRTKGLDEDRVSLFIMGVGEAITNSIKHAPRGEVYAGVEDDYVWVAISDQGKGIESLLIPRVVLLQGYSTKPSLGMGYSIMLDVSDRILLTTGDSGTIVLLMKCLLESPPGTQQPDISRALDVELPDDSLPD